MATLSSADSPVDASPASPAMSFAAAPGRPIILDDRAAALARYPHARVVGQVAYVSGVSSRRADNSHEGVTIHADGRVEKDINAQTSAVLTNIGVILEAAGGSLGDVVDITVFLVDMKDYAGMNAAWNQFFPDKATAPARTTVAVHQLPHANLLVEMKAIAHLGAPSTLDASSASSVSTVSSVSSVSTRGTP